MKLRIGLAVGTLCLVGMLLLGQQNANNFNGGAGGSGTVSNASAAGNAYYAASGTTVSADTNITDSGAGQFAFAQGTLAGSSTPFITQTATWNNGATAFTNFFSNVTCTAGASGSGIMDLQVGASSVFTIKSSTANCGNMQMIAPVGSQTNPGITGQGNLTSGFVISSNSVFVASSSAYQSNFNSTLGLNMAAAKSVGWNSSATPGTTQDTGLSRSAAGVVSVDTSTIANGSGTLKAAAYQTTSNCASSGGTCGSASSGSVSIAAAATTATVSTTAVTANSVILITEDSTLGTKLSVTCNTTTGRVYTVTTRTAGTSFVITASAAPATNPACLNYLIIN